LPTPPRGPAIAGHRCGLTNAGKSKTICSFHHL